MRCFLIPALLLAGCASAPSAPPVNPAKSGQGAPALTALDTTIWRVQVEPLSADEKPYADLFRFEDRHLFSAYQQKVRGFGGAPYTLQTPPGGTLSFEGSMPNADGSSLAVTGKATPEALWGTMTWRRADWSLRTYRFKGTPKAP